MKRYFRKAIVIALAAAMCLSCVSCGILQFRNADGSPIDTVTERAQTSDTTTSEPPVESIAAAESVAETTEAVTTAAPEVVDNVITFIATGDNIIHESVYTDAKNRAADGSFNFIDMYEDIADFVAAADLAFINQETIIGGASLGYSGYPNFNSPDESGEAIVKLGFDIVNTASNHMLDKKSAGLEYSINFWKNQPVVAIGSYENAADYDNVRIAECKGIKIALLSYTYGTNGMTLESGSQLVVPLFDKATIERQIAIARESADLVFVSCHWGDENVTTPSSDQKYYAQIIADAGADVIIGHHPHVLQPITSITGAGGNQTLCIYSLGNLISTMLNGQNMVGGFVSFDITKHDSAKPTIDNVKFIPTVTHYSMNRDALQVYFLANYTEELAAAHGCTLNTPDFTLAQANKFVTDSIAPEYLN